MAKNAWDTIIGSYIKPGDMVRHKPSGEHGIVVRRFPALGSTFIEVKFASQVMSVNYKDLEKVVHIKKIYQCKITGR